MKRHPDQDVSRAAAVRTALTKGHMLVWRAGPAASGGISLEIEKAVFEWWESVCFITHPNVFIHRDGNGFNGRLRLSTPSNSGARTLIVRNLIHKSSRFPLSSFSLHGGLEK
ncbi:hypothetical protein EHM92_08380 [bacterium]|nr:MAG: hypothetical protein EHM92_08380 [bacterium]